MARRKGPFCIAGHIDKDVFSQRQQHQSVPLQTQMQRFHQGSLCLGRMRMLPRHRAARPERGFLFSSNTDLPRLLFPVWCRGDAVEIVGINPLICTASPRQAMQKAIASKGMQSLTSFANHLTTSKNKCVNPYVPSIPMTIYYAIIQLKIKKSLTNTLGLYYRHQILR